MAEMLHGEKRKIIHHQIIVLPGIIIFTSFAVLAFAVFVF